MHCQEKSNSVKTVVSSEKGYIQKGKNLLPLVDLFSEANWCAEKQTRNTKVNSPSKHFTESTKCTIYLKLLAVYFYHLYELGLPFCRKINWNRYTMWKGSKFFSQQTPFQANRKSKKLSLKSKFDRKSTKSIALVKALFSIQKYWYFSYFSTKTYVVGTH